MPCRLRRSAACLGCRGAPPDRLQGDHQKPEPAGIGDKPTSLQRVAEAHSNSDGYPPEGEPADEDNKPTVPEARGHRIYRINPESLVTGRSQEMSNDTRNPCDEESREVAEHHLA